MTARLQAQRQEARRALHAEASRPALLIIGAATPVDVCVRVHDKSMWVGEMPGMDGARFHDTELHLRFWLDDLDGVPPRNAVVSVADGEAYRLGEAFDPHGSTVDVTATRLTVTEAVGLPVPSVV